MDRTRQRIIIAYAISILVVSLLCTSQTHAFLLFPSSSVLQVTSSISILVDLIDTRKLFVDMGLQMNYALPYTVDAFYNMAIWEDEFARGKRELYNSTTKYLTSNDLDSHHGNTMHPNDMTAGELYVGLERLLENYGIDKTCLMRSVCELAHHPISEDNGYIVDLLAKLLTFVLTPSQHDGFDKNEKECRDRYEHAEQVGFLSGDCEQAFPNCKVNLLKSITKYII
ncbi:uncharacterized protein LOC115625418 [Scaptodrosophila lebanonensis]|uniref:Uncharacterized protein LOC115625418 n=1 Tax=Drosophila lebanonensis TaxID=7225 RepID=A0A6J2TMG2_DROLE|nr:uncharacterized protein LOC115625418 [Scaptodrosophila lebanonensis]